ncbi:hypothetical protein ACSBR2_042306 [Camellia fascicularis]
MLECELTHYCAFYQLQFINTNFKTYPSNKEGLRVEIIARYPTANLYFYEVWKMQLVIMEEMENLDDVTSSMARLMKAKFDKYWEWYSVILSFAVILDPDVWKGNRLFVRGHICFLKSICIVLWTSTSNPSSLTCAISGGNEEGTLDEMDSQNYGWSIIKSQLDLYLEEPRLDRKQNCDLEILNYCKTNSV